MTGTEPAPSEKESAAQRARNLYKRIASRRQQTESNRIIDPESIEEMQDAGLFQLLQSAKYRGLERPAYEFFDVVVAISQACPSTGWVLGNLGANSFEIAMMEPEFQDELYHDNPRTLVSSSYPPQGTATTAPGGFRLSGRWRLSSGVDYAAWAMLGANNPDVEGEDKDHGRSYVVPLTDCQVIDDWYAMGLAGTGSKSIVVNDAYVPVHRTIERSSSGKSSWPGQSVNTGPLFSLPRSNIFTGVAAAPPIGAAKEMYQEFVREVSSDSDRRDMRKRADTSWVQTRLANAQSLISSSERRLLSGFQEMMTLAENEAEVTTEKECDFDWDISQTADDCLSAARSLFECMGAEAIYNTSPFQALYRDLIAMRQHGTQARDARALSFAQRELGVRRKKSERKKRRASASG